MIAKFLFNTAELALTSYAKLNTADLAEQINALRDAGLAVPQTDEVVEKYRSYVEKYRSRILFSTTSLR